MYRPPNFLLSHLGRFWTIKEELTKSRNTTIHIKLYNSCFVCFYKCFKMSQDASGEFGDLREN